MGRMRKVVGDGVSSSIMGLDAVSSERIRGYFGGNLNDFGANLSSFREGVADPPLLENKKTEIRRVRAEFRWVQQKRPAGRR